MNIKNVKEASSITLTRPNGENYHPLIISGTFKFDFVSDNIKVESGRFDFVINDSWIDQQ